MITDDTLLFTADTPVGVRVRTTQSHWDKITATKHPSLKNKETEVMETLQNPFQVRQSRTDVSVNLFYRRIEEKFLCVIVRRLNDEGFIVTAYFTKTIKEGEVIWPR